MGSGSSTATVAPSHSPKLDSVLPHVDSLASARADLVVSARADLIRAFGLPPVPVVAPPPPLRPPFQEPVDVSPSITVEEKAFHQHTETLMPMSEQAKGAEGKSDAKLVKWSVGVHPQPMTGEEFQQNLLALHRALGPVLQACKRDQLRESRKLLRDWEDHYRHKLPGAPSKEELTALTETVDRLDTDVTEYEVREVHARFKRNEITAVEHDRVIDEMLYAYTDRVIRALPSDVGATVTTEKADESVQ